METTIGAILLEPTSNEAFNCFFSVMMAFGSLSFGVAMVAKLLSRF